MALNTFNCNYLTPLHFKGLMASICKSLLDKLLINATLARICCSANK